MGVVTVVSMANYEILSISGIVMSYTIQSADISCGTYGKVIYFLDVIKPFKIKVI